MNDARSTGQHDLEREADSFTGGPGVVASKSQARGSVGGIVLGAIIGAIVGVIVGLIFFTGALGVIISTVAFAVGGATFGGVAGGFVKPRQELEGTEADR